MITVSLSLSLTTHTQTSDKHAACNFKKRNSRRKSKKNARSEDVVWSRRRSAGRHKEKEKVCMSGCLIVRDEKEEEDCEKEGEEDCEEEEKDCERGEKECKSERKRGFE